MYVVLFQPRSQGPRSFWSVTGIATSGQVQHGKSAIHGLPVTLRMLRVKSDKSDWFWSQPIVFSNPLKTGMSLDLARGPDCQRMTKGTPWNEVGSVPIVMVYRLAALWPAGAPLKTPFFLSCRPKLL